MGAASSGIIQRITNIPVMGHPWFAMFGGVAEVPGFTRFNHPAKLSRSIVSHRNGIRNYSWTRYSRFPTYPSSFVCYPKLHLLHFLKKTLDTVSP